MSWEVRRALRYGSERVGWWPTEALANLHALRDIEANGNVGRLEYTDRVKKIVYYDIHEELS